jgi:hypothetical protein
VAIFLKNKTFWGLAQVEKHLPSICKTLGPIPALQKKKEYYLYYLSLLLK